MELIIYQHPCWLLEAAELVHGLVNHTPAGTMVGEGLYCIPKDRFRSIQASACSGMDPEDPRVRFYFEDVPLEGLSDRGSCLGCTMLYSYLAIEHSEPQAYAQDISRRWAQRQRDGFQIDGIDEFTLDFREDGQKNLSLAEELAGLAIPEWYRMRLLEVLSAFDLHLNRLLEILSPVTQALPALLEPWTSQIPQLTEHWQRAFRENSPDSFFLSRVRLSDTRIERMELAFRFFFPVCSPGRYDNQLRSTRFHMGVYIDPAGEQPESQTIPNEVELEALRLLANPARIQMLRLMRDEPMSGHELAQALDLNSGTVSRDLNSLNNARLLLVGSSTGARFKYRTNLAVIRQILERCSDYLLKD